MRHLISINSRQTEKFHLGDQAMMIMMLVEVGAKIKSPFDEPIMAKRAAKEAALAISSDNAMTGLKSFLLKVPLASNIIPSLFRDSRARLLYAVHSKGQSNFMQKLSSKAFVRISMLRNKMHT